MVLDDEQRPPVVAAEHARERAAVDSDCAPDCEAALVVIQNREPSPDPSPARDVKPTGVSEPRFEIAHAEPEIGRQPVTAQVGECEARHVR